MKMHSTEADRMAREETLAGFGGAEIVKQLNGKLEIRGGTEGEKLQAHAWLRQFLTQGPWTVRRVR